MTANKWKDFIQGLAGVAIVFACFFGLMYAEHLVLERYIAPAVGTLPEWLEDFDLTQFRWVNLVSAGLACIWIACTSLADSGIRGDRRLGWIVLYALAFIAGAYAAFFLLPDTGAGRTLAMLFALLNGAVIFWFMTAFTSPQTHKYAPALSAYIRRGW
jgi:hypothetical protein